MKLELLILLITGFMIANTFYDGKFVKLIKSYEKYYKMIGFGFAGLSVYLFLKKNPMESKNVLEEANNIIKHMPMGKGNLDVLSPFMDFTNQKTFLPSNSYEDIQTQKIVNSGKKGTKRSVSETKKKFVAAQQSWCCAGCKKQLPAWFEVDHKVRLEHGGSNHVDNLVAYCRDCHGRKTAMENL